MTGYMFVYNSKYTGYVSARPDPYMGIFLNFDKVKGQLKILTQESIDLSGFPSDCYEDGYGAGFYPEDDEVCVELGGKMINASCLEERCKYDRLLDEEIEKHRIKDFDSLIAYLCDFNEPPEDFYGLIEVDIID